MTQEGTAQVGDRGYRRTAHTVFRALNGTAWVGGPGRDTVGIEGSALFVWLALEWTRSLSTADLRSSLEADYPELGPLDLADIDAAVATLIDAGLVLKEVVEEAPT